MAMTSAGAEKASAEINVTPLIDVLLVLLIIFMVVRPTRYVGEKAEIPRPVTSTTANSLPEETIVIRLLDSGSGERPGVAINHSRVDWPNLEARLRAIYSQRSGKDAFVQGDAELISSTLPMWSISAARPELRVWGCWERITELFVLSVTPCEKVCCRIC